MRERVTKDYFCFVHCNEVPPHVEYSVSVQVGEKLLLYKEKEIVPFILFIILKKSILKIKM